MLFPIPFKGPQGTPSTDSFFPPAQAVRLSPTPPNDPNGPPGQSTGAVLVALSSGQLRQLAAHAAEFRLLDSRGSVVLGAIGWFSGGENGVGLRPWQVNVDR